MASTPTARAAVPPPGSVAARPELGPTVFAEMTALARETGSVNLGQGFPDTDGPPAMLERAAELLRSGHNQYPPGRGVPELVAAVAHDRSARYGQQLDPDTEVMVTVGATEGVTAAVLALCAPGDDVIVIEPYYDSYAAAIAMAGARRVAVPLRQTTPGGRFALDPDELRAAVSPRTRLVIVNSPHNPTGTVLTDDELRGVSAVCCEHDLWVVTDEVYEHLTYDGVVHVPIATLPGMAGRTLTVSSAGKTFNVTGWKIGWVCGPAEAVTAVNAVKQFLTFTHSAPMQLAVAAAIEGEQRWVGRNRASLQARRDLLVDGLAGHGLTATRPQGSYFVQLDARSLGVDDAAVLARELAGQAGVVGVPLASLCDDPALGRPYLRLAFCKTEPVLTEAVDRLGRWLTTTGAGGPR